MTEITGGCLCGHIRYKCSSDPLTTVKCHCRECQKAHSAPYAALACMPPGSVNVTQGATSKYEHAADSGSINCKEFCPQCGTHLFSSGAAYPDFKAVKVATLDNSERFPPIAHVWAQSSVSWAGINDGLPVYQKQPGMDELERLWKIRSNENGSQEQPAELR